MLRLFLFALCLFTQLNASIFDWFNPLSDKAKRAQTVMEGFDPIVEKALKDYNVPGIAIGIVVDGHLIYSKGFGFRDLEARQPVTPDTVFPIGSCTKAFTAFAVATLVDEDVLHWDQLVIDVLPEFRLYDQYATQNLTMRDLLTHRSGMPRHDFMWYNSTMSRQEVMRRLRYLEPSCDLRERYQYNSLMYLTAGYAIEQLTGKTWEEVVKERILKPLKMEHTSFSAKEMQHERECAVPYIEKGNALRRMQFREFSLIGPGGSMNSTVTDLSHWVQMHLDGGIYNKKPLISAASLQEIQTPQVIVPGAPETKESLLYAYGIGWGISSYRGQYLVSHDGGVDGFTSVVGLLPHHKVGVIVLANKNLTSLARFISLQAIDRVLELPPIDWLKEGLEGVQKGKEAVEETLVKEDRDRKQGTSPSHPLEHFVGQYEHPGYGIYEIELIDGKLHATFNGITAILDHWHYDVFTIGEETQDTFVSRVGKKITFRNNLRGDIEELAISLEPSTSDIIFKRKNDTGHATLPYLRQFTGLYQIYGYTVEIAVKNHILCAIIPGQPIYELVPIADNEFTVKAMTGYTVRFMLNALGKVEEVLLIQPYGAFSAKPKN